MLLVTRLVPYWSRDIEVVSFTDVMMLDWDLKWDHIQEKQDAIDRLSAMVEQHPELTFYVYETPGGMRAFLVSHRVHVNSGLLGLMQALGCDGAYVKFTSERKVWNCRIGKKPGREGDYIARFVGRIGDAPVNEYIYELLEQHDELIADRLQEPAPV